MLSGQAFDASLRGRVGERSTYGSLGLMRGHIDDRPGAIAFKEMTHGHRCSSDCETQVGHDEVRDLVSCRGAQRRIPENSGVVDPPLKRGDLLGHCGSLSSDRLVEGIPGGGDAVHSRRGRRVLIQSYNQPAVVVKPLDDALPNTPCRTSYHRRPCPFGKCLSFTRTHALNLSTHQPST